MTQFSSVLKLRLNAFRHRLEELKTLTPTVRSTLSSGLHVRLIVRFKLARLTLQVQMVFFLLILLLNLFTFFVVTLCFHDMSADLYLKAIIRALFSNPYCSRILFQ